MPKILLPILLLLFTGFEASHAQTLTQQQISAIEKTISSEMLTAHTPGAAVGIIKDNRIIYEKNFGLANSLTKVALTDTTIFQIASVTKVFTSLTLLIELKKAKIEVGESIGKVVPGLSPGLSSISFHQLLTHTSGMMDYYPPASKYDIGIFDFFKENGDNLLFAEPGKVFSYSNTGYALIALIIERLTGKKYTEVVEMDVIKPLKLNNTTFDFLRVATRSFSTGHYYDGDQKMAVPLINHFEIPLLQAAGGIFSSIGDLERLALCLMNKGILDGTTVIESDIIEPMSGRYAENYTASAPYYGFMNYPNNAYGYGLFMFDYGRLHFIGNGGSGSQMTYLVYEPKAKFAMIFITNITGDFLISSFKEIFEVVLGEKEPEFQSFKPIKEEWKEITGKYVFPGLDKSRLRSAEISGHDGKLFLNMNKTGENELEQISNLTFRYSTLGSRFPMEISFYRDDARKVAYMRNFWRSWEKIE
jgi:CubicO group peptidase (beta-lactamase class C family)